MNEPIRERTSPLGEAWAYGVASVLLVVGGMLAPSIFLNWIVGPLLIVVTVSVLAPVLSSGRRR